MLKLIPTTALAINLQEGTDDWLPMESDLVEVSQHEVDTLL